MDDIQRLEVERDALKAHRRVLEGKVKSFPKYYWVGEVGRIRSTTLIRKLIEEHLNYSEEDIKLKLCVNDFKMYRLGGMLRQAYGDSTYKAINSAYPGRIYPWEMASVPKGFWENKEHRVFAMLWALKKEGIKFDDIWTSVSAPFLTRHGLLGLLGVYNGNMTKLKKDIFPMIEEEKNKLY